MKKILLIILLVPVISSAQKVGLNYLITPTVANVGISGDYFFNKKIGIKVSFSIKPQGHKHYPNLDSYYDFYTQEDKKQAVKSFKEGYNSLINISAGCIISVYKRLYAYGLIGVSKYEKYRAFSPKDGTNFYIANNNKDIYAYHTYEYFSFSAGTQYIFNFGLTLQAGYIYKPNAFQVGIGYTFK